MSCAWDRTLVDAQTKNLLSLNPLKNTQTHYLKNLVSKSLLVLPQTLRNRTDMIAQNKAAHKQAKGPAPFADGGSSAAASFSLRL